MENIIPITAETLNAIWFLAFVLFPVLLFVAVALLANGGKGGR